jgi:hypothetical protein
VIALPIPPLGFIKDQVFVYRDLFDSSLVFAAAAGEAEAEVRRKDPTAQGLQVTYGDLATWIPVVDPKRSGALIESTGDSERLLRVWMRKVVASGVMERVGGGGRAGSVFALTPRGRRIARLDEFLGQ